MKKSIKHSNRGLTFSFSGAGTNFEIGDNYRYIFDKKSNKIFMVSYDGERSLKVSRKKCGKKIKSLIDIRAKKVLKNFENADYLEVEIKDNVIVVTGYKDTDKSISHKNNAGSNLNKVIDNCKVLVKETIPTEYIDSIDDVRFQQLSIFDSIEDEKIKTNTERAIKVFSVFSGVGMLDKPFSEDKAFEIVKAVEIDKWACASYRENINDNVVQASVRDLKESDIPEADLLLGGTSCKVYSNANRVCRLEEHKDSDLLNYYVWLAKIGKFKAFILENVVELITLKSGEYFRKIKEELNEYKIKAYILKDNECGGYTTRKRVFIVGNKLDTNLPDEAPKLNGGTVGDALRKVNNRWFNFKHITKSGKDVLERMKYVPQGGNWMDIPKDLWKPSYKVGKTHSNTFRRLRLDAPSITLANFRKCNLIHPIEDRGLTVAEALAISGFNNDFKLLGKLSDMQMGIANGVPYKMALMIKNIVKKFIFGFK